MKYRVLLFLALVAFFAYKVHEARMKPKTEASAVSESEDAPPTPVKKAPEPQATPKPAPVSDRTLPMGSLNSVVTISGSSGSGTGFIANYKGKTYVVTNQHVLAGIPQWTIRMSNGDSLIPGKVLAATEVDIALVECASIPSGITPLEIATLPDAAINSGDAVIIPGNSKGDGVITQTPGKLLAIGPQRIEVDNPIYPGNSGSPIIHNATQKVVGVLTEAELVTFNEFEKASFRSKNSAIKADVRYFGHRIDSARTWEPLNLPLCQQTELFLKQSRREMNDLFAFLTDSSPHYKDFKELHVALNSAALVYNDKNRSPTDKREVYQRFLRDIDSLAKRAVARTSNRKIYYSQRGEIETISNMAEHVSAGMEIAKRDNDLVTTLLLRGN